MASSDDDEGVVSFDEIDDEMADLFSFGLDGEDDDDGDGKRKQNNEKDYSEVMASVMPRERSDSDDSFLAMLEGHNDATGSDDDMLLLGDEDLVDGDGTTDKANESKSKAATNDKEAQEMLEWLDQDDKRDNKESPALSEDAEADTSKQSNEVEVEVDFSPESQANPTLPEPTLNFESMEEALASPKATIAHFRDLLEFSSGPLPSKLRPQLWSRVIAPDLSPSVEESEEAKAFREWEASSESNMTMSSLQIDKEYMEFLANRIASATGGSKEFCTKALVSVLGYYQDVAEKSKPKSEATPSSGELGAAENEKEKEDTEEKPKETKTSDKESGAEGSTSDVTEAQPKQLPSPTDPLIPPIVCTLLSSGMSKVTAAVLLKPLLAKFIPLVTNATDPDRVPASRILHRHFYLLAYYHLPLLVYHLDRHVPNWFEAAVEAKKEGEQPGLLPISWFLSLMAGEYVISKDSEGKETKSAIMIDPKHLLCLWDFILTSEHHTSVRYFLVLAILEAHSGDLLLLNGDKLAAELTAVLQCRQKKDEVTEEGFSIEDSSATTPVQAADYVQKWIDDAQTIWEATPTSVLDTLAGLEPHVVRQAIRARQKREALEAQQRAHAAALAAQAAAQTEHEKKAEAARLRLTRARLVAFYRTHNPGKEDNIDKIMQTYQGRYEVLDAKLRKKYGVGFNPAIGPKPQLQQQQQTAAAPADNGNQNMGFGSRFFMSLRKEEEPLESLKREKMVATVSASEILPIVCWSKKGAALKASRGANRPRLRTKGKAALPPRYYLVDSRPEATVQEQGGFPTSVSLSPEIMLDAEKLMAQEAVFESLRGIVHICVMGEGFGALPALYGHKMTRGLHEHIKEDEARTLLCALYFVKKGYPFVSIFEGGFASAHAWLWRKGPEHQLYPKNVLTNYDPDVSMFGQFEKLHQDQQQIANSNTRDKKQRVIQNLFDSNVTRLSKSTAGDHLPQLDKLTAQQNHVRNLVVNRFFNTGSAASAPTTPLKEAPKVDEMAQSKSAATTPDIKSNTSAPNFFGSIKQRLNQAAPAVSRDDSNGSLEIESVEEFEKPEEAIVVTESDIAEGSSSTPVKRMPSNTFATNPKLPQNAASNGETTSALQAPSEEPENVTGNPSIQNLGNRFAGFGAALKSTGLAAATPQAIARNPFARFTRNAPAPAPAAAPAPASSGFAGLNILRKSALARVRSGEGEPSTAQTSSILMAEEEIDGEAVEDMDHPPATKKT